MAGFLSSGLVARAAGLIHPRDSTSHQKPAAVSVRDATLVPTHVIAVGGTKGGTGKSTTAVNLIVGLMRRGYRVGSLDLDGAQGTLTRYLANRAARARRGGSDLDTPRHVKLRESGRADRIRAREDEHARFAEALAGLSACDVVVVDTPGHDGHFAGLACAYADTLITPVNDSLVDLDRLAYIDAARRCVLGPGPYARLVWEVNDRRAAEGRRPVDWIVLRNRLIHPRARNHREVGALLEALAGRVGFRLHRGLGERVVFRELFLDGLTPFDLGAAALGRDEVHGTAPRRRYLEARAEVENLLDAVALS